MGDIVILFFFENIFIFCMIFWGLTWFGEYFYKVKTQTPKNQFYECGFKSINDINVESNFSFIIFASFLVLYDVEFLFLIPLAFNLTFVGTQQIVTLIIFLFFFLFSLFYDWQMKALNWQI